jgi:hypothetical protein
MEQPCRTKGNTEATSIVHPADCTSNTNRGIPQRTRGDREEEEKNDLTTSHTDGTDQRRPGRDMPGREDPREGEKRTSLVFSRF